MKIFIGPLNLTCSPSALVTVTVETLKKGRTSHSGDKEQGNITSQGGQLTDLIS